MFFLLNQQKKLLLLAFRPFRIESSLNETANVTGRDGREYRVHPPTPGEPLEVQSLSPTRPKSVGSKWDDGVEITTDDASSSLRRQPHAPFLFFAHTSCCSSSFSHHNSRLVESHQNLERRLGLFVGHETGVFGRKGRLVGEHLVGPSPQRRHAHQHRTCTQLGAVNLKKKRIVPFFLLLVIKKRRGKLLFVKPMLI